MALLDRSVAPARGRCGSPIRQWARPMRLGVLGPGTSPPIGLGSRRTRGLPQVNRRKTSPTGRLRLDRGSYMCKNILT